MSVVLFRRDAANEEEYHICRQYFPTYEYRSQIPIAKYGLTVIPRYSALPYYRELYWDVKNSGGKLINSLEQHLWIANGNWMQERELGQFTPKTYDDSNFYTAPEGAYVVKGRTNSRKLYWDKRMFARNKVEALGKAGELTQEPMIAEQGIVYREYIPLETWETGIYGIRFTNEWRFFFVDETLIDYGYYWSIASEETLEKAKKEPRLPFYEFAHKVAKIAAKYANFFVLDLAKTESGHIILIEINDGSMSGLSEIPAERFYENLAKVTNNQYSYK